MSENLEAAQEATEPVQEQAKESVVDGLAGVGEVIFVAGEWVSTAGEAVGGFFGAIGEALGSLDF